MPDVPAVKLAVALVTIPMSAMVLLPAIWAGEVYRTGVGTVVTMTGPGARRRRALWSILLLVGLLLLEGMIAVAFLILWVLARAPSPWQLPATLLLLTAGLILATGMAVWVWVLVRSLRGRRRGDTGLRDIRARYPALAWWLLANLARDSDDTPGTGKKLTEQMLAADQHSGALVTATAAAEALVPLYVEAGMTRVSDESLVLYRLT